MEPDFLFGVLYLVAFGMLLSFLFKMYNRTLRSRNIKESGWPPTHLNADGDCCCCCQDEEGDGDDGEEEDETTAEKNK